MIRYIFNIILLALIVLLNTNCKTKLPKYKTLDEERLFEMTLNEELPDPASLTIRDVSGGIIDKDSLISLQMTGDYFVDFMLDEGDNIVEGLIRPITAEDKDFILRINIAYNEGPPPEDVDLDCDNLDTVLREVERLDQAVRSGGEIKEEWGDVDQSNLDIVLNIIEKCGMPEVANQVKAIWLVIQHAPARYRERLFPEFEYAAENGYLSKSSLALMEDRILMDMEKPQIYGSQVTRLEGEDWKLYDLMDPETVDRRRAEVGLGPLEPYLAHFGVAFNVKQE